MKYRGRSKVRWPVYTTLESNDFDRLEKLSESLNLSRADVSRQLLKMNLSNLDKARIAFASEQQPGDQE